MEKTNTRAAQAIASILETRFGRVEAQALMNGRARITRMDVQFMDVKLMSELCERYRTRARAQILAYRLWARAIRTESDPVARLYGAAEGAALHRRIGDELKLWYCAHRDYHAMRRAYLMKCMGPRMRVDWDQAA
ncbi:MAG: hypothetical protein KDJ49_06080 [Alphaproteobacteria bacterium]|nr:hypothetical protein [Alphaproteobacteria bacterium]USO07993.1 MAG: hypothetical protein H6866_01875 [Rhodospirillales bacterium]